MVIIDACEITKTYPQSGRGVLLGRGGIASWFGPGTPPRQALAPMTLAIEAGESVGIIGRNGSGKSTLLKLIAGVSSPTSGTLAVHGRVASLLELGAGFHPMLTGRENIYLNAGLLGMRHAQTDACFDAVVDFAEMGEFIDQTVDTYSSGMYVRLAFSVAIHTNPDIFLVDEVLSVGDEGFQRKCRARILELKEAGKTILFVSHDLGIVNTLCDRVILLDQGQVLSRGGAQATIDFYLRQIGRASAVHRLVSGVTEAIFNHGRLSLYHGQREITAPAGIKIQFFSMGQYHESTAAEWTLTSATDTEVAAEGVLPRLPVTIHVRVQIIDGQVHIEAAWENHRPIDLAYAALQCFLPTSISRWQFGADTGRFPEISFNDRHWCNVVPATHDPGDCFLLGDDSPAVRIAVTQSEAPLQLDNTDYMMQTRLAHITEAIPSSMCPLAPGRRNLASVEIGTAMERAEIDASRAASQAARAISFSGGSAQMNRGDIAVLGEVQPLTNGLNLHVQIKIGGVWIMSQSLQWSPPANTDGTVTASGRSTRLPFALDWSLSPVTDGLFLRVDFVATKTVMLEEFNVSLALSHEYVHWETPSELGQFKSGKAPEEWMHLNERYRQGSWIMAASPLVPTITLRADTTMGTIYPTAILVDGTEQTPVLQLVCTPCRHTTTVLEPGRHTVFSGRVTVGTEASK